MKMNIHTIYKKKSILQVFVLLLLLTFSCMEERWIDSSILTTDPDATVTILIQSPGSGSTATRALTDVQENDIKRVDVLVFKPQSEGGRYFTSAGCDETDITTDNNDMRRKTFTVKLIQGDFDLVILSNAKELLADIDPENLTKSQLLSQLEASVASDGKWATNPFTPFPMWGDVGEVTLEENTNLTGTNSIKMTRMVARVDVKLSGEALDNFRLTHVYVYNYNTTGTLVPDATVWDQMNFRATAPWIPASAELKKGPLQYTVTDQVSCVQEIYLLETENHSDANHTTQKPSQQRTCLVVGGIWDAEGTNDFSGAASYYRIDFSFKESDESQQLYDILRNHWYLFNIIKVTGSGYEDPDTAFKSAPVNIELEVVMWDEADMEDIWIDGQYYYSITPQESQLWASASTDNEITVKTDYPTWSFELSDRPTPNHPAADLSNLDWLTITSHTPDQEYTANGTRDAICYNVERNTTGAPRTAYIHYSAGRFSTTVSITQYEWEIEDIWVDPTGDIGPAGETRTVTIQGVFSDINIRVRNALEDILLDNAIVAGSNTQSSNTLTVPVLWKNGQATISFEYYDMQQAQWVAIRTERQQGYFLDVTTSHTDGNEITNTGENFTIFVSGIRPDVFVRAIDGADNIIAGPVQVDGGNNSDSSKSIDIGANGSSQERTVIFQWSLDGITWDTISTGIQKGYDIEVQTAHIQDVAITNTGSTYQITVKGFYPDVYVRAVVQNTESEVATPVKVDGGSGTNVSKSITVDANESWNNRIVEFQWSTDQQNWNTITSGAQGGYNPIVTTAHTNNNAITNTGQGYQITVSGFYPDIYVRAVVEGTTTPVATQRTVNGGTTTNTSQTITVNANPSWSNRNVEFQWSGNGKSDWTTLTVGPQGGYAPDLSASGTPDPFGFTITVSGTGYAPALTLRVAVNNVQISDTTTPSLPAWTEANSSTVRTQNVSVPSASAARTVQIQYDRNGTWTTIAEYYQEEARWVLTSGRTVAKRDAYSNGTTGDIAMQWHIAMGIASQTAAQQNLSGNFYLNTVYNTTTSTGCGGYYETEADKGMWRLPTYNEMNEMLSNDELAMSYNLYGQEWYWISRESSLMSSAASNARRQSSSVSVELGATLMTKTMSYKARCVRNAN